MTTLSCLVLGSLLTEDAGCDKEIKKRIAMAKAAFMRRGELLRGNISRLEEKDGENTSLGCSTFLLRNMDT